MSSHDSSRDATAAFCAKTEKTYTGGDPSRRRNASETGLAKDAWGPFAPTLPALMDKSRQLVTDLSKPGGQIGDFEILTLLGEGAFGKVFLARQISLDREVALKVTANFGREGRTMARLQHSHIVQVFSETVDTERNLRLLCMQYVAGATLQHIIECLGAMDPDDRNGGSILSIVEQMDAEPAAFNRAQLRDREILEPAGLPEAVCWVGQQLAEALEYAHGQGVLHRDIKPANVIVNQYGQPMLADFSLSFQAKAITDIGTAVFGGTLGYMAPEHLNALNPNHPAGAESVDERSDIYSLGAVLLDLLTAQPRRLHAELVESSESIGLVTAAENQVDLAVLLEECAAPTPLVRVLDQCLRGEPQQRFGSAGPLAEALEGCRQILLLERTLPQEGALTRFAAASPLLFILVLCVVPNLLASAANVTYILVSVITEVTQAQWSAFMSLVFWYNVVVIAIMYGLLECSLLRLARKWRELNRGAELDEAEVLFIRRQTLLLPVWGTAMNCLGWFSFVIVIPIGMELLAGPVDRGVLWHISVAFFMTGVIGVVYNYYVITFGIVRGKYTRLWKDAYRLHERAALELAHIPGRNRAVQILSGLTPLGAASVLVLVGPERFTAESFQRFRILVLVLIAIGIAGFWFAMTATSYINQCVTVFSNAAARDGGGWGRIDQL